MSEEKFIDLEKVRNEVCQKQGIQASDIVSEESFMLQPEDLTDVYMTFEPLLNVNYGLKDKVISILVNDNEEIVYTMTQSL